MSPVVVQYFHKESGTKLALLDFHRVPQERSGEIKNQVGRVLVGNNLDINNLDFVCC